MSVTSRADEIRAAVLAACNAHRDLVDLLEHHPSLAFLPEQADFRTVLDAVSEWVTSSAHGLFLKERGRTEKDGLHCVEVRAKSTRGRWSRDILLVTVHVPDELIGTAVLQETSRGVAS